MKEGSLQIINMLPLSLTLALTRALTPPSSALISSLYLSRPRAQLPYSCPNTMYSIDNSTVKLKYTKSKHYKDSIPINQTRVEELYKLTAFKLKSRDKVKSIGKQAYKRKAENTLCGLKQLRICSEKL